MRGAAVQTHAVNIARLFFGIVLSVLLALAGVCAIAPQNANAASTYQADNGNVYYYGPLGNGVVIYGVVELVDPNVVIPDEIDGLPVTIIWQSAFSMYDGHDFIETVTLPESLTCVGFNAFKNCSNLRSVEAHGSFSMQKQAFAFCPNLTEFNYTGDMSGFALDKYPSQSMWTTYKGTPFEGSPNVAFSAKQCDGLSELVDMINTTSAEMGDPHHLTYSVIGTNPEPEPSEGEDSPSEDPADSDSEAGGEQTPAESSSSSGSTADSTLPRDSTAAAVSAATTDSAQSEQAGLTYRKVSLNNATESAQSTDSEASMSQSSNSSSNSTGGTAALVAFALAVLVFGGVFEATRYSRSIHRVIHVPGVLASHEGPQNPQAERL